jgi:hypothetical protein
MFVLGLTDRSAQKKLLSEKNLTLTKAFEIASSHEMASKEIDDMKGQSEHTFVKKTFRECFRCGKSNHEPDRCFYKDASCHSCGKKGHIY